MTLRLTTLAEQIAPQRWACGVCQWRCQLGPGEQGHCLVRVGTDDGIAVLSDGLASAAMVGVIEDQRLWHFFPGTPTLTIGGWGYAFPTDQQRGQYTQVPDDEAKRRILDPERVAGVALERLCRGVVWAYSEPAVTHEYVLDLVKTARAASRYTAIVTSGYLTREALDQYGQYLDGLNVEIRAFDDAAYRRLAGIDEWRGILDVATYARSRWQCHIEITTRFHPGVNDTPEQIQALASWIRESLGPQTAWHALPGDAGAAAAAASARARRIAHDAGLHHIYGADVAQSTQCSNCHATLVERNANGARVVGLAGSQCSGCGTESGIRTSIFKRG